MIRGIRVIQRISPRISRDIRPSHVTFTCPSAPLSSKFSRSLHTNGKTLNEVTLSTPTTVEDFNHVVNKLVEKTSGGSPNSKHVIKLKKATKKEVKAPKVKTPSRETDSFLDADTGATIHADSAVPLSIQDLMARAPVTTSFPHKTSSGTIQVESASAHMLKNHVETFCMSQPFDLLLSSLVQLIDTQSFQGAQVTLHYLIERTLNENDLYPVLQQAFVELCEKKKLPVFRHLMKTSTLVDTRKTILPFLLSTAVKMGKDQGHATSMEDVVALSKKEESGKIAKLGHQKLSSDLKSMLYDRPHDLLHLLEQNPEFTPLVSGYVMVFSTLLISSPYVEKQRHLWEKIFLHLSENQPLEWYISHERLLRDLSANFWGNVISRKDSPTLKELRMKVRKLPPSQAIWIQATLLTDELDHANALVEDMLNEGFSATEEIGQHLVKLFTKDMDPGEALDVIDNLHKQYGSYISLHTTFFSHWCRTRNSRAVVSMVKVLQSRDQMAKDFYILAFQRLLKNGDFKGALFLADMMARDSETSNHVTAGEFLSAALYRGRQSIFPKTANTLEVSDLMTEGMRYNLHMSKFATFISKFNESREEPTTRLPVHVILRYLNELHKRGLYASVAWYQYNLEMMQVSALTQAEVEVFLKGLVRLLSTDKCVSSDFDTEFSDIIQESEAIVADINHRMVKKGKGLVQEEESASASEIGNVLNESSTEFSKESGVSESSTESSSSTPPSYSQIFSSPYFQFETVKWGAIKAPKDPGSGVRILSMLDKHTKSYIRSYIVAEAIQHVAAKLYITTPPSYRRLRSQTSYNMDQFLELCEKEWKKPLKYRN